MSLSRIFTLKNCELDILLRQVIALGPDKGLNFIILLIEYLDKILSSSQISDLALRVCSLCKDAHTYHISVQEVELPSDYDLDLYYNNLSGKNEVN